MGFDTAGAARLGAARHALARHDTVDSAGRGWEGHGRLGCASFGSTLLVTVRFGKTCYDLVSLGRFGANGSVRGARYVPFREDLAFLGRHEKLTLDK